MIKYKMGISMAKDLRYGNIFLIVHDLFGNKIVCSCKILHEK